MAVAEQMAAPGGELYQVTLVAGTAVKRVVVATMVAAVVAAEVERDAVAMGVKVGMMAA